VTYSRVPTLRDQSGAPIDGGFPVHYNTLAQTGQLIAAGPCYLDAVVVGKAGDATWAISIYDAVNAGQATAANLVSVSDFNAGGTYPFNCVFENGIWISSTGTTAGDVTFIVVDPSKV
jgi:hypothetical protein